MVRRLILAVLVAPSMIGCMPYVFPEVIYTPEIPVNNEDGGVHAFRVDIDKTERKPKPSTVEFTLMKIPLDTRGVVVPSQLEIAPASGVLNPWGVVDRPEHERNTYTMTIRLYRPGYDTKEVKAWDKARSPLWTPARDLLAQEKALDDLLAVPADQPAKGTWWDVRADKTPGLQQGSVSKAQHDSLLFASSEYQRLAGSPAAGAANMTAVRARLTEKAMYLRVHAEPPAH